MTRFFGLLWFVGLFYLVTSPLFLQREWDARREIVWEIRTPHDTLAPIIGLYIKPWQLFHRTFLQQPIDEFLKLYPHNRKALYGGCGC